MTTDTYIKQPVDQDALAWITGYAGIEHQIAGLVALDRYDLARRVIGASEALVARKAIVTYLEAQGHETQGESIFDPISRTPELEAAWESWREARDRKEALEAELRALKEAHEDPVFVSGNQI